MLAGFFFDFLCDKNAKPSCKVLDFVAVLPTSHNSPTRSENDPMFVRCALFLEAS